jgi:predicted nucleotide-binding protein (sugar kinase/HSP70/actin superfamily)
MESERKGQKVLIPQMSVQALGLAAVMRGMGIDAEAMPMPDEESMAIGLSLCRGRECLPCFLCTGDILKVCRQPDYDAQNIRFFMPMTPGACRFGQYHVLQKQILAEEGFPDAQLISPSSGDGYRLFGDDPRTLRKRAWQGIVAVDVLTKILHEYRPYEMEPGSADAAFEWGLDAIVKSAEAGCDERLVDAMGRIADRFRMLAIDRSEERPLVGLVGEIYVVQNSRANADIVKAIERAGGEVLQSTAMEYLYYVDWKRKELAYRFGEYVKFLKAGLSEAYQHRWERKLLEPVLPILRHPPASPTKEAMDLLRPFYDPILGTEAALTMGSALDVYQHGISGVVNLLPFSCMPGAIVSTMSTVLRKHMDGVPWLDIAYDGQEETNMYTRLEAFMHQAKQFQRSVVARRQQAAHV